MLTRLCSQVNGIKELDDERAEEEQGDEWDPDALVRDYDAIHLPV